MVAVSGLLLIVVGVTMFPAGIWVDLSFGETVIGITLTLGSIFVSSAGAVLLVWDRGRVD